MFKHLNTAHPSPYREAVCTSLNQFDLIKPVFSGLEAGNIEEGAFACPVQPQLSTRVYCSSVAKRAFESEDTWRQIRDVPWSPGINKHVQYLSLSQLPDIKEVRMSDSWGYLVFGVQLLDC